MKKSYLLFTVLLGICISTSAQTDGCAGATNLPVGSSSCAAVPYSFSNAYTDAFADPSCGGSVRDAWFSFVATSAYTTINATSVNASGGNIVLSVYSACGAASEIGCANNQGNSGLFGGSSNEALTVPTTIGNTYYVRISRVGNCSILDGILGCSQTTSGTICAIESGAPANNQNCSSAVTLCNDASLSSGSPGFGTQELSTNPPQGCLIAGEHQSSWYVFSPQSTGTIQFTITPLTPIDYDFAIWGPFSAVNCAALGAPLRCSYAAPGSGITPTGLNGTAADVSEGAGGDSWVQQMTIGAAQVGQIYVMCIDNWTNNGVPFVFDWNLSGVTLDCTIPLPVELLYFNGTAKPTYNLLAWSTTSEVNSDYFAIEKSHDAVNWKEIGRVPAAENSNVQRDYELKDVELSEAAYYRLLQADKNGESRYFNTVFIERDVNPEAKLFNVYPNPARDVFNIYFSESGDKKIILTNQLGLIVYTETIIGALQTTINLADMNIPSGIYYLGVEMNGSSQFEKLMLNK